MKLFVNLQEYHQEVHHLLEEFFPNEEIIVTGENDCDVGIFIDFNNSLLILKYRGRVYERKLQNSEEFKGIFLNDDRNKVKIALYSILQEIEPLNLPWGSFTGVHPSKIVRRMIEKGYSIEKLKTFDVKEENIDLLREIYNNQRIDDINGLSLYINIPFCPSRCAYCSFPTRAVGEDEEILEEYIALIEDEIIRLAPFIKVKIDTIYIGGGTPTVLPVGLLERLLKIIKDNIDISEIKEYTVEAGRPDTINDEKLEILKEFKVDRISINPQTMNDETLRLIGRFHNVSDILNAFRRAKAFNFKTINADLIFGLEGEKEQDMQNSLEEIIKLNPENITIHTLSLKKGAKYLAEHRVKNAEDVKNMVVNARYILRDSGYSPYYLYRQKNMIGSLENTGYAKPGHEGLYNILMMDELSPIISIGMGAISKFFEGDNIERIADFREWKVYKERRNEKIIKKQLKLQAMGRNNYV